MLYAFRADTRTIDVSYGFSVVPIAGAYLSCRGCGIWRRRTGRGVAVAALTRTDTGKAIRAVAKEKLGAELSGIDVAHIYAVTLGLGAACVAIAACLLIPTYYVIRMSAMPSCWSLSPSWCWAAWARSRRADRRLFVGWSRACATLSRESLGQIGIFLMFILVLLFRPSGLMESAHERGYLSIGSSWRRWPACLRHGVKFRAQFLVTACC